MLQSNCISPELTTISIVSVDTELAVCFFPTRFVGLIRGLLVRLFNCARARRLPGKQQTSLLPCFPGFHEFLIIRTAFSAESFRRAWQRSVAHLSSPNCWKTSLYTQANRHKNNLSNLLVRGRAFTYGSIESARLRRVACLLRLRLPRIHDPASFADG